MIVFIWYEPKFFKIILIWFWLKFWNIIWQKYNIDQWKISYSNFATVANVVSEINITLKYEKNSHNFLRYV